VTPRFPFLQIDTAGDGADEIACWLFELGATGVETRDDTTTVRGPGGGVVRLVASFDSVAEAEAAAREVRESRPELACDPGEIVGDAWRDAYKQFFAPFSLTPSIVVVPPWVGGHRAGDGQAILWMDPGRAFGTGLHATTALVAAALEARRDELVGSRVLDVGTGSGILALVALRFGAASAVAIDNDPEVIDVALGNAARNQLVDRISVSLTPLAQIGRGFAVVVANIRATTLIEMADDLGARVAPRGMLVLSGVLASERDEVTQAFVSRGLAVEQVDARGEGDDAWVAIVLRAPME
jgi:ribosomal protein L11 methyltransferase